MVIDLYRLTIPASLDGAIQEVGIFRDLWEEGETAESRKILGKKIIRRALRRTLGGDVYDRGVRLTAVGNGKGRYTIKLTQEAVDALADATSGNSLLESAYERVCYEIWANASEY